MNTKFYSNCIMKDNFVLHTMIDSLTGERTYQYNDYKPHLYSPCGKGEKAPKNAYRTLNGTPLKRVDFKSIFHARKYIKEQLSDSNPQIYGNTNYQYVYLWEKYKGSLKYNFDLLNIVYLDIEVASDDGFPEPEHALKEITAITIKIVSKFWKGKPVIAFGNGDFKTDRTDVEYRKFGDEHHLIADFIRTWQEIRPDIVTGWYIEDFDIPYLINRMNRLFPDGDMSSKLSKWLTLIARDHNISEKNKDNSVKKVVYEIAGMAILDYWALYTRFSLKGQESYSLNNICKVEGVGQKTQYEGSLHDLYKNDYQKFIEYNIQDVELVQLLDKKLKFIAMIVAVAYDAGVNFYDVFAQTRMWDTIIYRRLDEKGIALPYKKPFVDTEYEGAFVKNPINGMHKWVVSFDIDSMYPMVMVGLNISPDTILDFSRVDFNIDDVINQEPDFSYLKTDVGACLSPSGYHFRKDKRGFLPEILIDMYQDRLKAKSMAIKYEKQLSMVDDEIKRRGIKVLT